MAAITCSALTYRYGRTYALHELDLAVPEGAIYALLGANGAGKTTLLQILMDLRRAQAGRATVLGADSRVMTRLQRASIGYVAEGQRLPSRMRLGEVEAYLAPLYPRWDRELAARLRERFALDEHRRIGTLSRGEHMKAALTLALAPRPSLLLMDEPFTGMDVTIKDELVRGLLASASDDGTTMVIASHDVSELETIADWVGFLRNGRMAVSEPMASLADRFKRVTVIGDEEALRPRADASWQEVQRAGRRMTFVIADGTDPNVIDALHRTFAGADSVELTSLSLREIFARLASGADDGAPPAHPTPPPAVSNARTS